jgi:teichuronic acid exporter
VVTSRLPQGSPPDPDTHALDLHRKVRSAYVWTFAVSTFRQVLGFGISMLLARFLQPADYGLIGMVLFLTGFLYVIQDLGFKRAVVSTDEAQRALPTLVTISTAMGAMMALSLFTAAPLIAGFFRTPELTAVIRWMSLGLFFTGIRTVALATLRKQLMFKRVSISAGVCSFTASVVAVVMAWHGFGVWSLVTNLLLASLLNTISVLFFVRPKFTLKFDTDAVKDSISFALPMLGSALLWKFYDNADYLIIGRLLGKEDLGFYTLAFRLGTIVNEKIGGTISGVSFFGFSAMNARMDLVVRHWLSVTRKSAMISFPFFGLLAITAEDFVEVVLGQRWMPAVTPLRLLCTVGVLRSLVPIINSLMPAIGKPGYAFQFSLINAAVLPCSFYIGCKLGGIAGVGWAWLLVFPFICLFQVHRALQVTSTTWIRYLTNLRLPALTMLAIVACVLPLNLLLPAGAFRFGLSVVVTACATLLCVVFTEDGRQMVPQEIEKQLRRIYQQA